MSESITRDIVSGYSMYKMIMHANIEFDFTIFITTFTFGGNYKLLIYANQGYPWESLDTIYVDVQTPHQTDAELEYSGDYIKHLGTIDKLTWYEVVLDLNKVRGEFRIVIKKIGNNDLSREKDSSDEQTQVLSTPWMMYDHGSDEIKCEIVGSAFWIANWRVIPVKGGSTIDW